MGSAMVLAAAFVAARSQPVDAATHAVPRAVSYRPPVHGGIIDPFRPPAHPYAPGNRGLDYAVEPGSVVRAAADGEVVFAGPVGASLHVTVAHGDGLRTSYSFLAALTVRRGQQVVQGDPVGSALRTLHFGVRDAEGNYLDPAALFGDDEPRVRLVPGRDEGRPTLSQERRFLRELVAARPDLYEWVGGRLVDQLRLGAHYAVELRLDVRAGRLARALAEVSEQSRDCTPTAVEPPRFQRRRIAVLVAGLGSTSSKAAVDDVDVAGLGYATGDVVRFSYSGGRVPEVAVGASLGRIPATSYGAADTYGALDVSAARLAELLSAVAATHPDVPIDVIAHSQGGVVAALALAGSGGAGVPSSLATLVTLASPHEGADLATAAAAIGSAGPVGPAMLSLAAAGGALPSGAALADLAETSPVSARRPAEQVPSRVGVVSIAASGDVVVPSPRSRVPGRPSTVISLARPDAHSRLPGDPATTREIALAVHGRPPTCRPVGQAIRDAATGEAVSYATDLAGASLLLAGRAAG